MDRTGNSGRLVPGIELQSFRWTDLERPVVALAPMEEVTDTVFRRLVRDWSRAVSRGTSAGPAVMFTEFTRFEVAIASAVARERFEPVDPRLDFVADERPLIVQLWGTDPERARHAGAAVARLGFDGVDINMGCPVRKIRRRGGGAAMIDEPGLAAEIVYAVREGSGLPVSVKTRIGVRSVRTEEWCGHLLGLPIDALTVHGRTAEQMSEGAADWDAVRSAVHLRDSLAPDTTVMGNGDVSNLAEARARCRETGADGAMIGRGIFADPLLFARPCIRRSQPWPDLSLEDRLAYLVDHLERANRGWDQRRRYDPLKKFFRNYVLDDTPDLLVALYETDSVAAALELLGMYTQSCCGKHRSS